MNVSENYLFCSDVSLVLSDGILPGHKMVLAARSDAWADLNEGDKVGKN